MDKEELKEIIKLAVEQTVVDLTIIELARKKTLDCVIEANAQHYSFYDTGLQLKVKSIIDEIKSEFSTEDLLRISGINTVSITAQIISNIKTTPENLKKMEKIASGDDLFYTSKQEKVDRFINAFIKKGITGAISSEKIKTTVKIAGADKTTYSSLRGFDKGDFKVGFIGGEIYGKPQTADEIVKNVYINSNRINDIFKELYHDSSFSAINLNESILDKKIRNTSVDVPESINKLSSVVSNVYKNAKELNNMLVHKLYVKLLDSTGNFNASLLHPSLNDNQLKQLLGLGLTVKK